MTATAEHLAPDPAQVLTRATVRAAEHLGLNQRALAETLGVSSSTVSRYASGARTLSLDRKERELAVLVVRLYRSLDALLGGDEPKARAWMHAPNRHLGGVPSERIRTIQGLVDVVTYLDALRGTL